MESTGFWPLDPEVVFLNHGSFGSCPRPVLDAQRDLREEMEREPIQFFVRELEGRLDAVRVVLADFLGCSSQNLALVPNATTGVNSVLRSLHLAPGDELLTTNHRYNACRNALNFVAEQSGAQVLEAQVPLPIRDPAEVIAAILASVTPRTRLFLLDHVTSPTGMVFPAREIVAALRERGIPTLVDGAHAPGMLHLRLDELGAAFYTGNFHKWVCAPKGAAFLHVHEDWIGKMRPLAISHGANARVPGRSRFHLEFDWPGTVDPTAYLCIPKALQTMGTLLPGGWDALRQRNRQLALEARAKLNAFLGAEPLCPEEMIGSLAAVRLPDGSLEPPRSALYADPLHTLLFQRFRVEVPIMPWPAPPQRLLRVSAQHYNQPQNYDRLIDGLRALL